MDWRRSGAKPFLEAMLTEIFYSCRSLQSFKGFNIASILVVLRGSDKIFNELACMTGEMSSAIASHFCISQLSGTIAMDPILSNRVKG